MISPNSEIIKTALMSYYRYKRQWLCATEVHCGICGETADIMVDTGTDIREVEIKCSKQDLWQGEAKKEKHKWYQLGHRDIPNAFYICVPSDLIAEAEKWINETNSKYGIIEFISYDLQQKFFDWGKLIRQRKASKPISTLYSQDLKKKIVYRMCSELITMKQHEQDNIRYNRKVNQ